MEKGAWKINYDTISFYQRSYSQVKLETENFKHLKKIYFPMFTLESTLKIVY